MRAQRAVEHGVAARIAVDEQGQAMRDDGTTNWVHMSAELRDAREAWAEHVESCAACRLAKKRICEKRICENGRPLLERVLVLSGVIRPSSPNMGRRH
jgi:hypothetical protein